MVRNVSFKADDDFDDKLYSASKKEGMTKSAFIKREIGKLIENNEIKEIKDSGNLNVNLVKEEDKKKLERVDIDNIIKDVIKEEPKKEELKKEEVKEKKEEPKPESKPESQLQNISSSKLIELEKNITEHKPKFTIKRKFFNLNKSINQDTKEPIKEIKGDNKMSGEIKEDELDRIVTSRLEKVLAGKEFNKNIKEMDDKIKDIHSHVCEDGKCTKEELSNIRKDMGQFSELKKGLEKLSELDDIKKNINEIKKGQVKVEICPGCGESALLHLGSYCSNCGVEIPEWTDDSGKPVEGWKHYKNRK